MYGGSSGGDQPFWVTGEPGTTGPPGGPGAPGAGQVLPAGPAGLARPARQGDRPLLRQVRQAGPASPKGWPHLRENVAYKLRQRRLRLSVCERFAMTGQGMLMPGSCW